MKETHSEGDSFGAAVTHTQPGSASQERRYGWVRTRVFHPEENLSRSGRVYQQLAGLTPADPWGNSRQNCLHGMRIVGNTQLVWNGQ